MGGKSSYLSTPTLVVRDRRPLILFVLPLVITLAFGAYAYSSFQSDSRFSVAQIPSKFVSIRTLPHIFYQQPTFSTFFYNNTHSLDPEIMQLNPGYYSIFGILSSLDLKNTYLFANITLSQGELDVALVCIPVYAQYTVARYANSTEYTMIQEEGLVTGSGEFTIANLGLNNSTLYYYITQKFNVNYYNYVALAWSSGKVVFVHYRSVLDVTRSQIRSAVLQVFRQSCY